MKLSIYARESSKDTNLAPPIDKQIERGKEWIRQHNYILIDVYIDNGFSGGDWRRPAWNQAKRDAKRHQYNILWVWNQDRIARDTEQFLNFYRILSQYKIKVYSDTEGFIDMSTLGGRVKHTALAQASEIFRLVTSEKVKKSYINKKLQERDKFKWADLKRK